MRALTKPVIVTAKKEKKDRKDCEEIREKLVVQFSDMRSNQNMSEETRYMAFLCRNKYKLEERSVCRRLLPVFVRLTVSCFRTKFFR